MGFFIRQDSCATSGKFARRSISPRGCVLDTRVSKLARPRCSAGSSYHDELYEIMTLASSESLRSSHIYADAYMFEKQLIQPVRMKILLWNCFTHDAMINVRHSSTSYRVMNCLWLENNVRTIYDSQMPAVDPPHFFSLLLNDASDSRIGLCTGTVSAYCH